MPPPATTEKELGETRIVNFTVIKLDFHVTSVMMFLPYRGPDYLSGKKSMSQKQAHG